MSTTDTTTDDSATSQNGSKPGEDAKPLEDQQFTTSHSLTLGGETIDYTAKVGRIVLYDDGEQAKPKVAIFYTAYLRDGVESTRDRPLVFIWNGGPGSSAVWLHMYSFGPRRIAFDGDPLYDTSRWDFVANDQSLLDVADLVFIDPPSTGFSRVAPGVEPEEFYGVEADAAAVGDFIAEFVAREHRGRSPLAILGESYGTLRAPAVAHYLQTKPGLYVDGVVLVSSVMDVASVTDGVSVSHGAIGYVPTYAATALYHGVVSGDLEKLTAEAEDFAIHDYAVALLNGSRLSEGERDRVARRLSELTGLSRDFILRCNLRVSLWRFMKELLRDRRRTVGRIDGRWVGVDSDSAGEMFEQDASMMMIWGPANRAWNQYVREDLGWEGDPGLTYRMMQGFPSWKPREHAEPWKKGIWIPQVETATLLRAAMNHAPHMKVLLQSGYYDVATPYFPAELTFDQLHLDPDRARNVTKTRYEAGHMMYLHDPSREAMRADLVDFLGSLRSPSASA